MAKKNHEDVIMKMSIDFFRDTILKSLGIDFQFVDSDPTELIELSIHSLYMDFTFLTTGGFYIHIEFQTTDGGEPDLRRFHAYEAIFSHKTGKKVYTYVVYSGGIRSAKTELDCGINKYSVIPIYLKDKDADQVFQRLKEKKQRKEVLTTEDFAFLSLTPLMSGSLGRKDSIKEALLLAKQSRETAAEKATAMLYALADKFLNSAELEEIKEVVAMTRLGQMIFDDGIQQGVQKGLTQGIQQGLTQGQTSKSREIVLRMLAKKQFSHEEIADLVGVSVDEVARIARISESE